MVGVSYGSPDLHRGWAEDEGFQYELWTDDDRRLSIAYGTGDENAFLPARETFLLNREGDLLLEYVDGVNTATSPYDVLDDCTLLFGGS